MAFFEQGSHRHYYYDAGAGRPVVLLHGLGNSGRAWALQVSALLALGYRVIVPDLLGHGASSDAPPQVTAHLQAAQVVALLEYLGLGSTHVVGLSLGGMVALDMACHYPAAVEKLIVAGTFACMSTPSHQARLNDWAKALAQPGGCLKRFEATWPALVGKRFAASARGQRLYQAWHAQAAMTKAPGQVHWCQGMKQHDLTAKLPRIQAPTLVLAATHDDMSPLSEAEAITAAIPRARLVAISGQGHVFNAAHAQAFNHALLDFLLEPTRPE